MFLEKAVPGNGRLDHLVSGFSFPFGGRFSPAVFRDHTWWCLGVHLWCQGPNGLGRVQVKCRNPFLSGLASVFLELFLSWKHLHP